MGGGGETRQTLTAHRRLADTTSLLIHAFLCVPCQPLPMGRARCMVVGRGEGANTENTIGQLFTSYTLHCMLGARTTEGITPHTINRQGFLEGMGESTYVVKLGVLAGSIRLLRSNRLWSTFSPACLYVRWRPRKVQVLIVGHFRTAGVVLACKCLRLRLVNHRDDLNLTTTEADHQPPRALRKRANETSDRGRTHPAQHMADPTPERSTPKIRWEGGSGHPSETPLHEG
jgi:hypothetical protein